MEMAEERSGSVIPYMCLFIDAGLKDMSTAALQCIHTNHDRKRLILELQTMWTTPTNPNPVLPLLSVRSGFDLFFRVMNFPAGSEVIMSAMNIPDMVKIVKHHRLHIVPLDISIETAAPKVELLPQLVSSRTVAIVIAHLYGKWSPMDEIIEFAKKQKLYVVEDCAEAFCGFGQLSHPQTDLALFSFGVIKFYTSFGGAIAKVESGLYIKMAALHDTYHVQSQVVYLKKILKYVPMYFALNVPTFIRNGVQLLQLMGVNNYKDHAVKLLRGFPNNMMQKIREQPCGALLATMVKRQKSFSPTDFYLQRLKGEYVASRLPASMDIVGCKATINNYWLFPVIVEDPDNLMYLLNALGVDAYRGATQLNIVEPANGNPEPLMDTEEPLNPCPQQNAHHSPHPHQNAHQNPLPHIPTHHQQADDKGGEGLVDYNIPQNTPIPHQIRHPHPLSLVPTPHCGAGDLNSDHQARCKDHVLAVKRCKHVQSLTSTPQCGKENSNSDHDARDKDHVPAVNRQYPHEAKYLVDHVLYLPVSKLVPFHVLNHMIRAIHTAVALDRAAGEEKARVILPSKL